MSGSDERPLPCGSGRVLMLGTVVLAAAGAAVLVLGAQDARLLRLGLVAALWAALLGAFAAARMRREISSGASRADQLRTVYQLELEREVAARREHTLTVERELREQVQQAEQREIVALRAELAAMRTNLEKLTGGDLLGERVALRVESARLLPMPAHPHKFDDCSSFDDKRSTAAAMGTTAKVTCSLTAAGPSARAPGSAGSAVFGSQDLRGPLGEQFRVDRSPVGSALPTSEWPVNGRSETALTPCEDPEVRFGPGRRSPPELDTHRPPVEPTSSGDRPWNPAGSSAPVWEPAPTRWDDGISHAQGNGRHGAPSRESSGSSSNGSHKNGAHSNGGGARREAPEVPVVGAQRSVNDLLAAHGGGSVPRRRHSRGDGPNGDSGGA